LSKGTPAGSASGKDAPNSPVNGYKQDDDEDEDVGYVRRDFGTSPRAAGESVIGRLVRRTPSKACNAPATAGAVGTMPISPTPLEP
jgi:hypothetical protein